MAPLSQPTHGATADLEHLPQSQGGSNNCLEVSLWTKVLFNLIMGGASVHD